MIEAFNKVPKAKLGGATYQWVHKSCEQFARIFNNIENIKTPFILLSAQNDKIVDVYAHQKFIKKAQDLNKSIIRFKNEKNPPPQLPAYRHNLCCPVAIHNYQPNTLFPDDAMGNGIAV